MWKFFKNINKHFGSQWLLHKYCCKLLIISVTRCSSSSPGFTTPQRPTVGSYKTSPQLDCNAHDDSKLYLKWYYNDIIISTNPLIVIDVWIYPIRTGPQSMGQNCLFLVEAIFKTGRKKSQYLAFLKTNCHQITSVLQLCWIGGPWADI